MLTFPFPRPYWTQRATHTYQKWGRAVIPKSCATSRAAGTRRNASAGGRVRGFPSAITVEPLRQASLAPLNVSRDNFAGGGEAMPRRPGAYEPALLGQERVLEHHPQTEREYQGLDTDSAR